MVKKQLQNWTNTKLIGQKCKKHVNNFNVTDYQMVTKMATVTVEFVSPETTLPIKKHSDSMCSHFSL